MSGECFYNTFVIVLVFVKYANTEEEKSYLANCEKPDDFCCFALCHLYLFIKSKSSQGQ